MNSNKLMAKLARRTGLSVENVNRVFDELEKLIIDEGRDHPKITVGRLFKIEQKTRDATKERTNIKSQLVPDVTFDVKQKPRRTVFFVSFIGSLKSLYWKPSDGV